MKKQLFAILLAAVLLLSAIVPAAAHTDKQQNTADALNHLGLFLGMGDAGYALDNSLTRAQGITLLVRMIGKEAEAEAGTWRTPFTDVLPWAEGYVGYAYTHSITNGVSDDRFGSMSELKDYMFLTLVLRALGHTDSGENPEFVWNKPYGLAKALGLIDKAEADTSFTRGDAVEVFWNAMDVEIVGKDMTLAESLIAQGIFTAAEYEAAADMQKDGKAETNSGTSQKPSVPEQEEQPSDPTPPADDPDDGGETPPVDPPAEEEDDPVESQPELGETERN